MSDDKPRDRRPLPRAPGQPPPKRTMVGMPLANSDGPTQPHGARAGLSGRKPGTFDEPEDTSTRTARGIAPASDHDAPDRRYMDPPSESGSAAATWQQAPSQPAQAQRAERAESAAPSWQTPVEPANPYGTTGRQPVRPSMNAPNSPPPPPPKPSPYSASAPEEWRTAARSVADKARASGGPASNSAAPTAGRSFAGAGGRTSSGSKGPNQVPTLRLKLDADEVEGHEDQYGYGGVPKSRLPTVLLVSLILILAAGGSAYWAEQHGGLGVWAARLHLTQDEPAASAADPASVGAPGETVPPAAAHGDAIAAAPPPSAATNNVPGATPTVPAANGGAAVNDLAKLKAGDPRAAAAAATATTAAQDENAKALAEPELPTAADLAARTHEDKKPVPPPAKAHEAASPAPSKAAVHHAAARATPRAVTHHEPVLKIRDLGSATVPSTPPEPSDTPYVPTPRDEPPTPDEPR